MPAVRTMAQRLESERREREKRRARRKKQARERGPYFAGLDGEGVGRAPHRYVLLAWSSGDGNRRDWIEDAGGLSSARCLDFLLRMPHRARAFAYSFGYDLTMMLRDLPDAAIFRLHRPDQRGRTAGGAARSEVVYQRAERWCLACVAEVGEDVREDGTRVTYPCGRPTGSAEVDRCPRHGGPKLGGSAHVDAAAWTAYRLNLLGTRFTVASGNRARTLWDVWKFFQSRFTRAVEDWTPRPVPRALGESEASYENRLAEHAAELARLARTREMKDKRGDFDKLGMDQIRAYCLDECRDMAVLAERLTRAHERAGLKLRGYYGAGSTAAAMLEIMGVRCLERGGPGEIEAAVARAFFGGRFELSRVGTIAGEVWGYDISSAYPYQIARLPCLGCGRWVHTKNRADLAGATAAVVRYALASPIGRDPALERWWGPLPFRLDDGSICFPDRSGGGWAWLQEYEAAERLWPNVSFREAWTYRADCDCRPFRRFPEWYRERVRIGKDGPGIVIKLGCNAGYGKLAQSTGRPKYRSWIWAGIITSNTRAMILDMIGRHRDPQNLLMIATDGIYTRERLSPPPPADTGTGDLAKPLGGWEEKREGRGVVLVRPGIYCPVDPTPEEAQAVRARGIGRATLHTHWRDLAAAIAAGQPSLRLPDLVRFHGAKSSIHRVASPADGRLWEYRRRKVYGEWTTRPVEVTFDPMPKRAQILAGGALALRSLPADLESAPYDRATLSAEAEEMRALDLEAEEQPDGDLSAGWED